MLLRRVSSSSTPSPAGCKPNHLEDPPMMPQWLVSPCCVVAAVLSKVWESIVPGDTETNALTGEIMKGRGAKPAAKLVALESGGKRSSNLSCETVCGAGPISSEAQMLSAVPPSLLMRQK